jgi:phage shock protein A
MGFMSRIARLIKANINALISGAEDPEKVLNQIIVDMSEQLTEARKQVAIAIADEKRLNKQLEDEALKAKDWERRAMIAVKAGDDALAREALARKKQHEDLLAQYQGQWQKQKASVDQLKLALRALNNKIEEAKRKKSLLIARQKRAEAQARIQETLGGLKSTSAFEAFDQMASKIEQMEAHAEAQAELAEEYTGDALAQKFGTLEATTVADEELVKLKRQMGLLPPEPARAPVRVQAPPSTEALEEAEEEELARALAEIEAEPGLSLEAGAKPGGAPGR